MLKVKKTSFIQPILISVLSAFTGCANLGYLYYKGEGVKQDYKKANDLYKTACDGGDMWGCYNLGVLYTKGEGVKQDHKKASDLYKTACDGGLMRGCNSLGVLYENGWGVKQDKSKAKQSINMA